MIRDIIKTTEYFDKFIEEEEQRVSKYEEFLKDARLLKERTFLVKGNIFELKLGIIVAKYSRGDYIESLKKDYIALINLWMEAIRLEWIKCIYEENLWFIAIGKLLGIEEKVLQSMQDKLKERNICDWLINYLLCGDNSKPDEIEGDLLIPDRYQTLKRAIYDSDSVMLKRYLETEWYCNCRDYGWYDSHKLDSQRLYFGYWCFEAAAICKLLKLDDSDFEGQDYYPYDLVHYKPL